MMENLVNIWQIFTWGRTQNVHNLFIICSQFVHKKGLTSFLPYGKIRLQG